MISIIQALDLFDDCVSNDDVWRTASNVFKLHGSEWVTLGRTSSRGNSPPLLRTSVPEELMHAYIADNLSNDDPWISYSETGNKLRLLDIPSALNLPDKNPEARLSKVFNAFGIRSVMLLPQRTEESVGSVVLYAVTDEASEYFKSQQGQVNLRILAAIFSGRYSITPAQLSTKGVYNFGGALSRREIETLQWLSSGMSTAQIAHEMEIAPVTVSKNLTSVKRKLKTSTREESLAVALRIGLLSR